jgi:hypothetical protein
LPGVHKPSILSAQVAHDSDASGWRWRLLLLALMGLAGLALYGPYIDNPFVFDDGNIFFSEILTQAATEPWQIGPRGLPYFTLGWVQTQIGSMAAHRLVGLALHVAVSWQLFRFLESLFGEDAAPRPPTARNVVPAHWVAAWVAFAFLLHPVAVYAAGYLVQRTTVMATLFTLMGLRNLYAGLSRGSANATAQAALFATLAILCKEHAVVVPFASLSLLAMFGRPTKVHARLAGMYLLLCVPAILYALRYGGHAIGQAYEPGLAELEAEVHSLPSFSSGRERWLLSALNQAQLFFSYAFQWWWPNTAKMSVDLRIDFLQLHGSPWAWLALLLLGGILGLAAWAARRWPRARPAAFGLFFVAGLYVVEMGTVRLQEPYVLYRSYTWAIGYAAVAASLLALAPRRALFAAGSLTLVLLVVQARDRLESFSSRAALWEDAAAKLASHQVAGASRILFNRGNERFRQGNLDGAMSDINEAITLAPTNASFRIARAQTFLRLNQPEAALADLAEAQKRKPAGPQLWFVKSHVLRVLGDVRAADDALARAAASGHFGAKLELARRKTGRMDVEVLLGPPS